MNGISPQLQNQIAQYQQVQQQLQNVMTQKGQMESQQRELQRTVEELAKADGDVYRNVGMLLIKVSDKAALKDELEESLETLGIRIRGLERQEKDLREKYEVLGETINRAMGNAPVPKAAPARSDNEED
ncbi:prefoldin subunit beta [Methanomethylophilus alvi]|uniref:prefoldin subunit beta n=1 Tax=Methanomethylophilus alvi TaxID=1291540 RepID=UPI0037DC393F